jgi:hypothetical protein
MLLRPALVGALGLTRAANLDAAAATASVDSVELIGPGGARIGVVCFEDPVGAVRESMSGV